MNASRPRALASFGSASARFLRFLAFARAAVATVNAPARPAYVRVTAPGPIVRRRARSTRLHRS